ncbi:hypothetical protein X271_00137 [Candidatus Hepatoplasma crinochetorum Av]|uniref:Uncharacterized protein n=1 Tax=Candidatus Hepatoplasma crinochetorum Av TaxID=1427984 RepID=W8GMI9_9MOLU|nr:hypothetical protein [Candidatus Hepatoplasma crinochetorum]AHK22246.1 hypothetical protein X271_00137 [Candidatus Hepatoplasma crinochetorum Av]
MKKDTWIYYISKTFLWISLLLLSITFFIYFEEQIILLKIGWKSAALSTSSAFIIYSFINSTYYFTMFIKKWILEK